MNNTAMVATSSGTVSLNTMWHCLFLGAHGEEDTLSFDCTFVMDNAKSHQSLDQFFASAPEMPVYRRSLKRWPNTERGSSRSSSGMKRNSRDNRCMSRFQSFPVSKATHDDRDTTFESSVRARGRQALRRSVSSDDYGDIAVDRWLIGEHRGKTFGKIIASSDGDRSCSTSDEEEEDDDDDHDDDDDDDDDDEPPAYACCNAHRPTRQASEDPEVVRQMVESMQQKGIIPID
eukprot:scaffold2868_cov171-Amphora_coffeaeformis.AAC.13